MNERDRAAADDWMREHLPDPNECSLEDNEEEGDTQSYFFLRLRDSATVVYKVAVFDGKVTSVRLEVYHGESRGEEPDELRELEEAATFSGIEVPKGTVVYLVEFGDGTSVEMPEALICESNWTDTE